MHIGLARSFAAAISCLGLASACTLSGGKGPETAVAPGADEPGWLAAAQGQIAAREYWASENGEGLQAPNRAHNLRSYFSKSGVRVLDRTASGSPELLRLSLSGVGRDERIAPAVAGETPVARENRVEIRRGELVEWYVNSEAGLEQGFTIEQRPGGDGPLAVQLALSGAHPSLRGDAIALTSGSRTLRFGDLVATDAAHHSLIAHFEVRSEQQLRIVVDDADAVYPLVIDPLFANTSDTQLESNQGSSQFGITVAGAGDVNGDGYADVIVGAHLYDNGQTDEGAAFVFKGSASGIANSNPATAGVALLESNQATALFGIPVAGAGDVNGDGYADVIVGARLYDNGQTDEGAAFVFLGSATGIPNSNPATAGVAMLESNQTPTPSFPDSVASAGDVNGDGYSDVIVGAGSYDNGLSDEGAAFVFLGSATGVANGNPATAAALLWSNQSNGRLGISVAGAGDVNGDGFGDVIVGAWLYSAGQAQEGAAFVFKGSATGIANSNPATAGVAQLESNMSSSDFGISVAGAGDVNGDGYADVIVGASFYNNGQANEGAAFVFPGSATGIANSNPATAGVALLEEDQASAFFGGSVAGAGDANGDGYADVIVGATGYDNGQTNEGAAFVFVGSGTGIASGAAAAAQLEANQGSADYGVSVAGAGDVNGDGYADVIVGADLYDAGQTDEGAAFLYRGGAIFKSGNPATAAAQLESNQANANAGWSVAGAGDVNGDGYADVLVGAPFYDAGQGDEGAAFLFPGSASGIASGNPATAAAQLESNQAFAQFGSSVAGAGDVNGDGYADVIVGAPYYDAGQTDEGAAFVFLGSVSGLPSGNPATAAAQLESNQAYTGGSGFEPVFGIRVAGVGDVNGDGYADVMVGAPQYDVPLVDEGAAFLFLGSGTGVASGSPATAAAQFRGAQASAQYGIPAGAGDVIIGAPGYTNGQSAEGAAFVYLGSASGIASGTPATAATQYESNVAGEIGGYSVASAGDVNGDGYADVIVGLPGDNSQAGAAGLFFGSATGIVPTAPVAFGGGQSGALFGWSVAGAGDINGDGYADIIVGAAKFDNGQTDEGAAFVFLGSASGIPTGSPLTADAQLETNQVEAAGSVSLPFPYVGLPVAGAGDVNGDGFADVIIGARYYDNGQGDEGAAFLFLGNSKGRPVLDRQRRGNGSGIAVQPWGLAHSTTGFTAELRANDPAGRGRVKAELQACPSDGPPAVAFGDASCTTLVSPSWIAVGGATPDVLISETFSGLANNTIYRWRARILHAPAIGAIPANPAHGPWRRVGAQSVEADIRLPEPGLALSLASGVALLAALALRRQTFDDGGLRPSA